MVLLFEAPGPFDEHESQHVVIKSLIAQGCTLADGTVLVWQLVGYSGGVGLDHVCAAPLVSSNAEATVHAETYPGKNNSKLQT
jgi:hypothetical protein